MWRKWRLEKSARKSLTLHLQGESWRLSIKQKKKEHILKNLFAHPSSKFPPTSTTFLRTITDRVY